MSIKVWEGGLKYTTKKKRFAENEYSTFTGVHWCCAGDLLWTFRNLVMSPYNGNHGSVTYTNNDGWDEEYYNSYGRKVYLKHKCTGLCILHTNINKEKRKKI